MGVHVYHDALPGFSAAQVLHDGCDECEERGADPSYAIGKFDQRNFVIAWQRAAAWNQTGLPDLARAEIPTFRVLWAVQLHFERLGVPIGTLPIGIERLV